MREGRLARGGQDVPPRAPAEQLAAQRRLQRGDAARDRGVVDAQRTGSRRERPAYVTGDTVWYEGVAQVARRFDPALVIVFAGAARTRGPFHLTMDGNDALETAVAFPRATLVGVHAEGWAHFTESANDLARAFDALGHRERLVLPERGRATPVPLARAVGQ